MSPEQLTPGSRACLFSVSVIPGSPRLSHHPSTAGRADTHGWALEERTYEVSQPCAAEVLDLVQVDLW